MPVHALISLFCDPSPDLSLSKNEIALLAALNRAAPLGVTPNAAIATILRLSGKEPRMASIHDCVRSLTRKGLLSEAEKVASANGGRPATSYVLTRFGKDALNVGVRLHDHVTGRPE